MLNQDIAQRFIDRLDHMLDFNINIMDIGGTIIASRDPMRIGTFHEVARELLVKGLPGLAVTNEEILPPGVLPGINLPVVLDGKPEGVIGITGDASDLTNIAVVLKSSLETMLEYERVREEQQQHKDRRRILSNALLFHDPTTKTQRNRILQDLGFATDLPRLALVFDVPLSLVTPLAQLLQGPGGHGIQDIFLQTPDGRPVVFKTLELAKGTSIDHITEQVESWIENLFRNLAAISIGVFTTTPSCFCGTVQNSSELYGLSYHHAIWTQQYLNGSGGKVEWFWDYSRDYLLSLAAPTEIESLVGVFDRALVGKERLTVLETLRALDRAGNGMKETASDLGIHRNTLVLRLQKIRSILGLDPLNRNRDRELSRILCHLLEK